MLMFAQRLYFRVYEQWNDNLCNLVFWTSLVGMWKHCQHCNWKEKSKFLAFPHRFTKTTAKESFYKLTEYLHLMSVRKQIPGSKNLYWIYKNFWKIFRLVFSPKHTWYLIISLTNSTCKKIVQRKHKSNHIFPFSSLADLTSFFRFETDVSNSIMDFSCLLKKLLFIGVKTN